MTLKLTICDCLCSHHERELISVSTSVPCALIRARIKDIGLKSMGVSESEPHMPEELQPVLTDSLAPVLRVTGAAAVLQCDLAHLLMYGMQGSSRGDTLMCNT